MPGPCIDVVGDPGVVACLGLGLRQGSHLETKFLDLQGNPQRQGLFRVHEVNEATRNGQWFSATIVVVSMGSCRGGWIGAGASCGRVFRVLKESRALEFRAGQIGALTVGDISSKQPAWLEQKAAQQDLGCELDALERPAEATPPAGEQPPSWSGAKPQPEGLCWLPGSGRETKGRNAV